MEKVSTEKMIKLWKKLGVSDEEIKKMQEILDEVSKAARKVKKDYEKKPSKESGAVDIEKGLVSGSGVQVHAEVLPDNENDEWELMPKIDTKDIASMNLKIKKKK